MNICICTIIVYEFKDPGMICDSGEVDITFVNGTCDTTPSASVTCDSYTDVRYFHDKRI